VNDGIEKQRKRAATDAVAKVQEILRRWDPLPLQRTGLRASRGLADRPAVERPSLSPSKRRR
jgi:hypothetical protein